MDDGMLVPPLHPRSPRYGYLPAELVSCVVGVRSFVRSFVRTTTDDGRRTADDERRTTVTHMSSDDTPNEHTKQTHQHH